MSAAPSARPKATKKPTKKALWLAARRPQYEQGVYVDGTGCLGASEAAAAMGLDPWCSPHDLWLEKMNLGEKEETTAMRRGNAMEPFIANEYRLITGIRPTRSQQYSHPAFPFITCTPDLEIIVAKRKGILQLKDVGYWPGKQFGKDGADQIPEHYLIQIQHELMVCERYGFEFVQLCACVDGRDIRVFTYTHNPELFDHAHVFDREATKKLFSYEIFWWKTHIIERVEPPLTGLDSDMEWVQKERASYDNGKKTNCDEATDDECRKLEKALIREKRSALVAAGRKNRIRQFMATRNASVLESSVGDFTYNLNVKGVASFRTPFKTSNA